MGERRHKSVLFLGSANHRRSRFAEVLFNSVAERTGLPWRASSRGLGPAKPASKTPMDPAAIRALESLGIRALIDCARPPAPLGAADLEEADLVVVLDEETLRPPFQERFPERASTAEYWQVHDFADVLSLVDAEVRKLAERLDGDRSPEPEPSPPASPARQVPRGAVARVGRETKGRRGKGVTVVSDLPLDEAGLLELAAHLKQRCGTGGTVKEGRIEIQGDQRARLVTELEALGYKVKRDGG